MLFYYDIFDSFANILLIFMCVLSVMSYWSCLVKVICSSQSQQEFSCPGTVSVDLKFCTLVAPMTALPIYISSG